MHFRRILVDIDALAADHPALTQARNLAKRSDAEVTVVDVLPDVPPGARRFVTAGVEQELVAHREERLAAVAGAGRPLPHRLLRGNAALAIVQEVIRGGFDLVVRSHGRELAEPPKAFGALDMQLLRKCPCPVWLVAAHASDVRRVLACVDASPDEPAGAALNQAILDAALTMSRLHGATLTVLYAWSLFGRDLLRSRMRAGEFDGLMETARQAAAADLEAVVAAREARQARAETALVEGEPERVIPEYARAHQIELVVMGTVVRTRVAGFIMGSTAERVLQELRGSVLTIKPPGFVSPVSPGS